MVWRRAAPRLDRLTAASQSLAARAWTVRRWWLSALAVVLLFPWGLALSLWYLDFALRLVLGWRAP